METEKREQSMINNLKAVKGNRFGAAEAKFKISKLRVETGQSEQSLLAKCVLYAIDNMPEFKAFREVISREWDRHKKETIK